MKCQILFSGKNGKYQFIVCWIFPFSGKGLIDTVESQWQTALRPWKFVRGMGCSSHWGVNHSTRAESKWQWFREIFSIFYTIIAFWVYSLESSHWGNSNECRQHTMSWYKKSSLSICFQKNFIGTQKRVQINHGKRVINVRAMVNESSMFKVLRVDCICLEF